MRGSSFQGLGRVAGVIATMAAGALLAACTSSAQLGEAKPAVAAAASAPVSGDTIGSGSVRVALLVPSSATGNAGALAANLRNAAQLAVQEFVGANLQILVKDDKGTPEGARAATTEALAQGAELIIGPLFSQSVTAAASVARPAGIPIVAFSTDASIAARGVYLLGFLPQTDVERVVSYAASQGKRSIVALLPANAYGAVAEAALQKAASVNGGRVIAIERYNLDRVDMQKKAEAIADVIKTGQADTLFMPDAGDAAPFLAEIISSKGIKPGQVQYLGSGQWDDPRVAAEPMLKGGWYPAPDKSGFSAFAGRYQGAFGAQPLRAASLAYDATSLAAGLVARFGDKRFSAEMLTSPSGFTGVDGIFRFLPDGTNQRGLAIYQLGGGVPTIVDPAPKTFSNGVM